MKRVTEDQHSRVPVYDPESGPAVGDGLLLNRLERPRIVQSDGQLVGEHPQREGVA